MNFSAARESVLTCFCIFCLYRKDRKLIQMSSRILLLGRAGFRPRQMMAPSSKSNCILKGAALPESLAANTSANLKASSVSHANEDEGPAIPAFQDYS